MEISARCAAVAGNQLLLHQVESQRPTAIHDRVPPIINEGICKPFCFSTRAVYESGPQSELICPTEPILNLHHVVDANTGNRGDLFRRWPTGLLCYVIHTGAQDFDVRILFEKSLGTQ
jgi:hypothetical protein